MSGLITYEEEEWTAVLCTECNLAHKVLTKHRVGSSCPYCSAPAKLGETKKTTNQEV